MVVGVENFAHGSRRNFAAREAKSQFGFACGKQAYPKIIRSSDSKNLGSLTRLRARNEPALRPAAEI